MDVSGLRSIVDSTAGPLSSPAWLFLSLIPSGLGFVLFVYGRKQERYPQLVAGLAFMIYPYFATTIVSLVGVGSLIGAALWYAVRAGY
jgi:hypothetical protein